MSDWIETFTGKEFRPLAAKPGDICIEDIAHSLSLQCRFAGHVSRHYSVAEHSLLAMMRAQELGLSNQLQLRLLLHDASEAYLVDLPSPVKHQMPIYQTFENHLSLLIKEKYGVNTDELGTVIRHIDREMLRSEAQALMPSGGVDWDWLPEPVPWVVARISENSPWPEDNEQLFLEAFAKLLGGV